MKKNEREKIVKTAVQMAKNAQKANEVPVGAVIFNTQTGEILTKARNQTEKDKNILAHAEMLAIRKATKKLNRKFLDGYSMFVTLEPCCMCAGAIAWARLDGLYYGATDPKTGAVRQGAKVFTRAQTHHKIKVQLNKTDICGAIMHDFFQKKRLEKKTKNSK